MKLFIWNKPYPVRYGSSQVWAVAETVEDAKRLACSKAAVTFTYGTEAAPAHQRDWSHMNLGEPTQVMELPCAVWDEWSE